ncbi:MAG: tetratricopeptide repeat protein [Candidatus Zixiibacteriota bacterium]
MASGFCLKVKLAKRYSRGLLGLRAYPVRSSLVALFVRTLIVCSLVACLSPVAISQYLDSAEIRLLNQLQDHLMNDQFCRADSICTTMINQDSSCATGHLFRGITMMTEMVDREENLYPVQFERTLDKAETLSLQSLQRDSLDVWSLLVVGHTKMYRSLWQARFGSTVGAIRLAMQARGDYERALHIDSSFYDLYLGLGLYHYWKSAKAGLLRSIGLFKNDRDRGIRELYFAADSSIFSRQPARSALASVWLDRKQYDSVIALCRDLLREFPHGKAMLWPLGEAYVKSNQYADAAVVYATLRERLQLVPGNYFNLIECDYNLYRCREKLKEAAEAHSVARRTASYYSKVPATIRSRQRSKLAYLMRASRPK